MELKTGAHIHLMGICGTAMASLAGLLKNKGYKVTGSDQNVYPPMSTQLEDLNIPVALGYKAENLEPRPDFVIVGNVITKANAEAEALLKSDIPYTSLPKALGQFIIENRDSIVVSGTHGKTTTTSLLTWVAQGCGVDPGFLVGGIPRNFDYSFKVPQQNTFIIEGDEYDTAFFDKVPKFIHYRPKHVILTSIEYDHADIYPNLDAVKSAFKMLIPLIPKNGVLVHYAGSANIDEVIALAKCKVVSYGDRKGDYRLANFTSFEQKSRFQVLHNNSPLMQVEWPQIGRQNALNATAAIALAHQLNWSMNKVREALLSFKGVKRRQEVLGEPRGILIIDDFAHHPTAVKETVAGVKHAYANRPVYAVFEPRSATSRRKVFQKDYVEAFEQADHIILANAFDQSKIDESERFSVEQLASDLASKGKDVVVLPNADAIVKHIEKTCRSNDTILIMSNGGFDGIYGKLMKALKD